MTNHHNSLDLMFQALADKNRREIIAQLGKHDLSVSALREPLGISMPATLQHIGILEQAGLVSTEKKGRVRMCTLDRTQLSKAEKWISERRKFWADRLDAIGHLIAALPDDPE